jgi:hypothetical protein
MTVHAIDAEFQAGPLRMRVAEAVLDQAAVEQVAAASDRNVPPDSRLGFAAARIQIENSGPRPVSVQPDDFGFVTEAGRIWQGNEVVPPEPALVGTLQPGESVEGWVAGVAEAGAATVILAFRSRSLGGDWANQYVSLRGEAELPGAGQSASEPNEAGSDPGSPAGVGETVVTADWIVTLVDVSSGDGVVGLYPESDYRTVALARAVPDLVPLWIGLQLDIQCNGQGDQPRHFPVSAFGLAYADGSEVMDVRILSAPRPELAGDFFPGGTAHGWYTIETPPSYAGSLIRFQPFRSDDDVRYFTWGDGSAPAAAAAADEPTPVPPDTDFAAGATLVVIEEGVNMRDAAGTSGEIVEVLALDARLTVIGGPTEGDGYTWYEVENPDSDLRGFVASNFLREVE